MANRFARFCNSSRHTPCAVRRATGTPGFQPSRHGTRSVPATFLALLLVTCVSTLHAADGPLSIENIARDTPVDFEKEILPILRANCSACHNERKAEANLVL